MNKKKVIDLTKRTAKSYYNGLYEHFSIIESIDESRGKPLVNGTYCPYYFLAIIFPIYSFPFTEELCLYNNITIEKIDSSFNRNNKYIFLGNKNPWNKINKIPYKNPIRILKLYQGCKAKDKAFFEYLKAQVCNPINEHEITVNEVPFIIIDKKKY